MRYFVLVFAAAWLAIGITVAYAPQSVPVWFEMERFGPWMRLFALVPLVIGLVLFAGAPRFHARLYMRVIGALAAIKGILLLLAPASYSKALMSWYVELPVSYLRVGGFANIVLALVLVVVAMISLFEEDVV